MPEKRGGGGWGGGPLHRAAEWAVSLRDVPGAGCRETGEGGKGQVRAAVGPAETRTGGGA